MIPDLPDGMSNEQVMDFYSKLCGNLQDQSSIHVNWFTHRRNPSVCWICDMNIMLTKMISINDSFITKSSVDIETSYMSDSETESEIEMNLDDEPVPEYEVEDD